MHLLCMGPRLSLSSTLSGVILLQDDRLAYSIKITIKQEGQQVNLSQVNKGQFSSSQQKKIQHKTKPPWKEDLESFLLYMFILAKDVPPFFCWG